MNRADLRLIMMARSTINYIIENTSLEYSEMAASDYDSLMNIIKGAIHRHKGKTTMQKYIENPQLWGNIPPGADSYLN